jgi:predicted transglutaminase-like cysteine proteinase
MSNVLRSRAFARVLTLALAFTVVVASACDASAKSRAKKQTRVEDGSFGLLAPLLFEGRATRLPPAPSRVFARAGDNARTPARFFSMNAVLAKHDAKLRATTPYQVASAGAVEPLLSTAIPEPMKTLASNEPFGLFTFRAPDGVLWTKWRRLDAEMNLDNVALANCRDDAGACSSAERRFLAIVDGARSLDGRARIARVNASVNASIHYMSDMAQHGVPDKWSGAIATFSSGLGDCEDYAIAKYAALQQAGTPADALKLLLVRDTVSREDHAVLAVRNDGRWLVLDNRWDAIAETSDVHRLMPLFAVDGSGVKLFAAPYVMLHHESETDIMPAADLQGASGSASDLMLAM